MQIGTASLPTLYKISADFVMVTGDGAPYAYCLETGVRMTKDGFIIHCTAEYGPVACVDNNGNLVTKLSGQFWWDWDDASRRRVQRLVMRPTSELDPKGTSEYNLWYNWRLEMEQPNLSATINDIEILYRHLLYISDNDHEGAVYFLHWLAWLWNHPDSKIPVAIMLFSRHGRIGKSMLFDLISRVFGKKLCCQCPGAELHANFNDALEFKRIMFLNELARADKQDSYEKFKSLISERTMRFEGKGRASRELDNPVHWIITTNNADCLPLMQGDGRVLVLRCEAQRLSNEYYEKFGAWIDGDGPAAVAGCFRNWVFPEDFDPNAPAPQTAATIKTQKDSRGPLANFLEELIATGKAPFDKDLGRVASVIEQLETIYPANMKTLKPNHKTLPTALQQLGHTQIMPNVVLKNGNKARVSAWVWRRHEHWEAQPGNMISDYLNEGLT